MEITVGRGAGERVRVSVADTGRGIYPADLDRAFVAFERLDAGASGIEGSGLGLALSRNLVEAMDGAIGAASAPGSAARSGSSSRPARRWSSR